MSNERAADDYKTIKQNLDRIRREQQESLKKQEEESKKEQGKELSCWEVHTSWVFITKFIYFVDSLRSEV